MYDTQQYGLHLLVVGTRKDTQYIRISQSRAGCEAKHAFPIYNDFQTSARNYRIQIVPQNA